MTEINEVNIYGYKRLTSPEKTIQEELERREQERKRQLGLCSLCGGNHKNDKPIPIQLTCPKCKKLSDFTVIPHCPAGVSHGEIHNCTQCNNELFLVIYYDGWVSITEAKTS